MGTMTYVSSAGTLTADYTVDSSITYPYPVVKYSSLAKAGDTLAKVAARLPVLTIIDCENTPMSFSDFAVAAWNRSPIDNGGWGFYAPNLAGLLNADISMVANSSTKAALVNALPKFTPNSYVGMRIGKDNSGPLYFTGKFTGTPQGHVYNGLQIWQTNGGVIGPLKVTGVPGLPGGVPPYETFPFSPYHAKNITFNDIEIDGNGSSSGGIGSGSMDNAGLYQYNRVNIHGISHGAAITHYNLTNTRIEFNDCITTNLAYGGINFERCGGSVISVNRHTFGNSPVDMVIDSDTGFATVTITDPKFTDGRTKINVCVHKTYSYPPISNPPVNKQLDTATNNHVTLIVNGVSRPDLINFVSNYTPTG